MQISDIQHALSFIEKEFVARTDGRSYVRIEIKATNDFAGMAYNAALMTGNYKWFSGDNIQNILDRMERHVYTLPTKEEALQEKFTKSLAAAIEDGKAAGVSLEMINPLVEAMKKISENAITDQRGKDEAG